MTQRRLTDAERREIELEELTEAERLTHNAYREAVQAAAMAGAKWALARRRLERATQ